MYQPADMSLWQGRVDDEETTPALRWHQSIEKWDNSSDLNNSATLLGFACDEGVKRNQGRPGSRNGPNAIRSALANLAYHQNKQSFDAGNIHCEGKNLEQAQQQLAEHVSNILTHQGRVVVLGGGHEMAWGSFLGLADYLNKGNHHRQVGIINFDAHFDLRNPKLQTSSGTPFRQISEWHDSNNKTFHYLAISINPTANSKALFDFAKQKNVQWIEDTHCTIDQLNDMKSTITQFLSQVDELYLTICLDVFPGDKAPGVSAPSALGVEPIVVIKLIQEFNALCEKNNVAWQLSDIAEMNPEFDQDGRTAKLAARLVHEIVTR